MKSINSSLPRVQVGQKLDSPCQSPQLVRSLDLNSALLEAIKLTVKSPLHAEGNLSSSQASSGNSPSPRLQKRWLHCQKPKVAEAHSPHRLCAKVGVDQASDIMRNSIDRIHARCSHHEQKSEASRPLMHCERRAVLTGKLCS